MAMGSHRFKLSGTPRKRGAGDRNDHGSADVAILSIGADSLFRDDVPVLSSCKKTELLMTFFIVCFQKQTENSPVCCGMFALGLAARR